MHRSVRSLRHAPLFIITALAITSFILLAHSAGFFNWVVGAWTVLGGITALYAAFGAVASKKKAIDINEYEQAIANLAQRVTLEEDLERQRLLDRAVKPARMQLRGADFLHSYNSHAQPHETDSASLFHMFWNQLNPRRMLLLGEPGAGKTLLLLELIRQAAEARRANAAIPIFIRINVAQWPDGQSFDDFLVQRVADQHYLPNEIVHLMLQQGRIVPLLDGLDEFDRSENRPVKGRDAIRRLNRVARGSYPLNEPLVVTCRLSYFQLLERMQLGEISDGSPESCSLADEIVGLHGASYFLVERLDANRISAYLRDNLPDTARSRWSSITDMLRSRYPSPAKTSLVTVLSSPWRLMLAFRAYREHGDPSSVLFNHDIEDVEARLLPQFLAVALQWRGKRVQDIGSGYGLQQDWLKPVASDSDKVTHWLKQIAVYLQSNQAESGGAGEFVPFQIYRMLGTRLFRSAYLLCMLIAGAAIGALIATVAVNGEHSFIRDIAIGGAIALLIGGIATAVLGSPTTPAGMSVVRQIRTPRGLLDLVIALFCALAASAFTLGTQNTLGARALGGACCGFISGLFFGFVLAKRLRARQVEMATSVTPSDPLRGGLGNSAVIGLVVAGIYGSIIFLIGDNVLTALVFAGCTLVVFAPVMGMPVVSMAWSRYRLAVFILFLQRKLPWRIATFLEWSYASGLMRTAGLSYQFRHLRLQKWLAETAEHNLLPRYFEEKRVDTPSQERRS